MTSSAEAPLTETRTDIAVEVYKHLDGRAQPFGWRAVNRRNSNVVAIGGEAYARKATMLKQVNKLFGEVEIRIVAAPIEVRRSRSVKAS